MFYIQFKSSFGLETVDQFDTRKEARLMLIEYQMVGGGDYYISTRACTGWND